MCEAQWTQTNYTVSFTAGSAGGSTPSGSTSSQTNKHVDDTINLTANGFIAPTGWQFNGWSCGSGVGNIASGGSFTMPAANVVCEAQWTQTNYTVSFTAGSAGGSTPGGGTSSLTNKHYGDTITLPASTFTAPTGYEFDKWSCDNSIGDKAAGGTFTMPAASVECEAQWTQTAPTSHNLTFDCNNGVLGSGGYYVVSYAVGATVPLNSQGNCQAPDSDAEFDEWSCTGDTSHVSVGFTNGMPDEDVTCHANWVYDITYHSGNCNPSEDRTVLVGDAVSYGAPYSAPTSPQNVLLSGVNTDCIKFIGWSTGNDTTVELECGAECNGVKFFDATYTDLYAVCTLANYPVVYHSGTCSGNGSTDSAGVTYGTPYTVLGNSAAGVTVPNNYVFQGWSDNSNSNSVDYEANDTFSLTACPSGTSQIDLYGVCSAATAVTYNCGGGLLRSGQSTSATFVYGTSYSVPGVSTKCSRTGYTVKTTGANITSNGWLCTLGNGGYLTNTSGTWTNTSSTMTCTAQWSQANYTVTFSGGDSSNDGFGTRASGNMASFSNKTYQESITLPDNAFTAPSGYEFDRWKCNQNVGYKDAGTTFQMPAANVTCTAQWTPRSGGGSTVNITYVCAGDATTNSNPGQSNPASVGVPVSLGMHSVASTYCVPNYNDAVPYEMTCRDSNDNMVCSGGDNGDCYIADNNVANITCTIYYQPKNCYIVSITSCAGLEQVSEIAHYYVCPDERGSTAYWHYDDDGPYDPITDNTILASQTDNSCFIGYSFEACQSDRPCGLSSNLGHAIANSYGEWFDVDYSDPDYNSHQFWTYTLDYNHALRLDSLGADPLQHGTEFLWYCSPEDVHDPSQVSNLEDLCYGREPGLYPVTLSLSCCSFQSDPIYNFGMQLQNQHRGYRIDWTHPLSIDNNANNEVAMPVPVRPGYVFLGYYDTPDGTPGTQYIDVDGHITEAGMDAAAVQNVGNMIPSGTCAQWHAHWCPENVEIYPDTGVCELICPDGYTPDYNTNTCELDCDTGSSSGVVKDFFQTDGTLCSYGVNYNGVTFEEGSECKFIKKTFDDNGYADGFFGVSYTYNGDTDAFFGKAICSSTPGTNAWNTDYINQWTSLSTPIQENNSHDRYCWCSLIGGLADNVNYPLEPTNWIYIGNLGTGSECEDKCTATCAAGFYDNDYSGFLSVVLNDINYCVPDEYTVEYYCDRNHYLNRNNEPATNTDIVYYGTTGYDPNERGDYASCEKPGRTFTSYSCYAAGDTSFSSELALTDPWTYNGNVFCVAGWANNSYTITLNDNGGSGGSGHIYTVYDTGVYRDQAHQNEMTSSVGNVLGNYPVAVPQRSGHVFHGYYSHLGNLGIRVIETDGRINGTGLVYGKNLSSNGTWYAWWDFVIKYLPGTPGNNVTGMPESNTTGFYGDTYTLAGAPQATGYIFKGWDCSPALPGTDSSDLNEDEYYIAGATGAFNDNSQQDFTCTAQWEENVSTTYSVTYDCNNNNSGGTAPAVVSGLESGQSTNAPSGSSCTAPTGQHFFGWSCSNGTTSTTYLVGEAITIDENNIDCDGIWIADAPCANPDTFVLGSLLNQSPVSSWNENPVGSINWDNSSLQHSIDFSYGRVYVTGMCSSQSGIQGVPIDGTPSVSGSPLNQCWCRVTAYDNDTTDSTPAVPLDYTSWIYYGEYSGSCNNASCAEICAGNAVYLGDPLAMRQSLYTYYRCPYTVSFAPGGAGGNNANGSMASITSRHEGDTITLPDNGNNPPTNGFSLDGYTFSGWKCGSSVNNNATLAANDTFTMPAANVTCTAQWNPNTIYLTWDLDGGTINGSNAPMCTYGTSAGDEGSITPISDPTRDGYTFNGWTINAGLPTGYTRLLYLQSDGSQYIDTTITYSALEDIVVNVKAQSDYTSNNNSSNNIALGFGNGSGQWFGVSSAGKWNIGPAPDYSSDVSASNVTDGLEITWSGGAESLKINGVSVTSNRGIGATPTNSLQLFGRNNAGSFRGRIYYVRVFQGGALQRNYIPVQYGNALGMFDTVTGEFFGNQGTGSFTGQ